MSYINGFTSIRIIHGKTKEKGEHYYILQLNESPSTVSIYFHSLKELEDFVEVLLLQFRRVENVVYGCSKY